MNLLRDTDQTTSATHCEITEELAGIARNGMPNAQRFKELILEKDTTFEGDVEVESGITCLYKNRYSLTVHGSLKARKIEVRDIRVEETLTSDHLIAQRVAAKVLDVKIIVADSVVCYETRGSNVSTCTYSIITGISIPSAKAGKQI